MPRSGGSTVPKAWTFWIGTSGLFRRTRSSERFGIGPLFLLGKKPSWGQATPPGSRLSTLADRRSITCDTRTARTTIVVRDHRVSRSEEHTSELQSRENLVCRLLLEKKKQNQKNFITNFLYLYSSLFF